MKYDINKKNIRLILENDKEIQKMQLQNFINGVPPKDQASELHQIAALNAGVVDANMKNRTIQANFKNKVVHAGYADRDNNQQIDTEDIKKHLLAGKSL